MHKLSKHNAMAKKILIVDDNVFMVEVMTYILNNSGYEVISLHTGGEVLDRIKKDTPDLVILDMVLPGMDGREVCQLLKMNRATKDLPVIMCSSNEEVDTALHQQGAPDDILHKPFGIDTLMQKVAMQLAA